MLSSRPIQLTTDGAYFPTKTPGRGLKNRAENAHVGTGIAMTVNGKGKIGVAPKTPFQLSSVQPERLFKGQKTVLSTITRPLGDKTPLPNRLANTLFQTPLPRINKTSKLNDDGGNEEGGTPDSIQRPSSMRKHLKQPRNSGKKFETPVNNGNHWDVSDGDIVLLDAQAVPEPIVEGEDDLDEVEYGAPNTLDLPYEPPFDFELPDYKQVGKTLFQIGHSFQYDDAPAPADLEIAASEIEEVNWNMISLPELESDDPFHLARTETASASLRENTPAATSRQRILNRNAQKPITAALKPRPQSSLAEFGTKATVRTASRVAPSSAATTASIPPHRQRVVSSNSVKSASSTLASKRTAGNMRADTGAAAPKPLSNTSRVPANPDRTAVSRTVSAKVSSSTTGIRSVAKPTSSVSRSGTNGRRPHTSTAFNAAKSKVPAVDKQGMSSGEGDLPLIKYMGGDLEDFDFKFDV